MKNLKGEFQTFFDINISLYKEATDDPGSVNRIFDAKVFWEQCDEQDLDLVKCEVHLKQKDWNIDHKMIFDANVIKIDLSYQLAHDLPIPYYTSWKLITLVFEE